LIEGESGTGKESIAYAIHGLSTRKKKPFIPVNCASIPQELMESELFGGPDSRGLLRSAEAGTLFLDEITKLPLSSQTKLVRAIVEKEVRSAGSSHVYPVDIRVIAATNRNLDDAAAAGKLQQDLLCAFNSARIEAPPLRFVKEDIPVIAMNCVRRLNRSFARNVRHIAPDAMAALMAYDFPGNVRELENILERAYALGAENEIGLTDLPTISSPKRASASTPPSAVRWKTSNVVLLSRRYGRTVTINPRRLRRWACRNGRSTVA